MCFQLKYFDVFWIVSSKYFVLCTRISKHDLNPTLVSTKSKLRLIRFTFLRFMYTLKFISHFCIKNERHKKLI